MKRAALAISGLLASIACASAFAAHVTMIVSPLSVAPGAAVHVSAATSPCLKGGAVVAISKAFPGRAFGGEGALSGHVGRHGAFSIAGHIRAHLPAGSYAVTARCGGGNLGVTAHLRVT